jgi:hypothetical protein
VYGAYRTLVGSGLFMSRETVKQSDSMNSGERFVALQVYKLLALLISGPQYSVYVR